jgi:hypothetical protein
MSEQVVGGGSKSGNHMSKIAIIYTTYIWTLSARSEQNYYHYPRDGSIGTAKNIGKKQVAFSCDL